MKRRSAGAFLFALLVLSAASPEVARGAVARASQGRRFGLLSRRGAEISLEVPRFGLPLGDGYSDEYALDDGWGFGFGLVFSVTDNILAEGRVVQTVHQVVSTDREWDLDEALVGARFLFTTDDNFQPYLAAGGSRLALEWDPGTSSPGDFARLSGYGGYASAGIDYVMSPRWVFGVRADYVLVSYTHAIKGTKEGPLNPSLRSDVAGFSAALSYRVPVWW